MAHVLFFFIDGLGIPPSPVFSHTTLFSHGQRGYPRELPGGGLAVAADARLGIPGLPQSATGQSTLITGINASALMGRHVSGFPGPLLKALIKKRGLFARLRGKGVSGARLCFANAFRPEFFEEAPSRVSASTFHALSAGVPLATLEDLSRGEALYHDFTNGLLIKQGYPFSLLSPGRAGEILARLTLKHTFTFYEYFLTDLAGHKRDSRMAFSVLGGLEEMLLSLLDRLPLDKAGVVVASDHGNVEDLGRSPHTTNPVPVMAWGRGKERVLKVKSIQDVPLMVEDLVGEALSHFTAMPTSPTPASLQRPMTRTTSP